jgi:hypothetical protein
MRAVAMSYPERNTGFTMTDAGVRFKVDGCETRKIVPTGTYNI